MKAKLEQLTREVRDDEDINENGEVIEGQGSGLKWVKADKGEMNILMEQEMSVGFSELITTAPRKMS
ncbi:unnamed protein product [Linum trigynum]|uniref:Uncharacterized protein n=1 Tax=Linum trigynum TaxID=586398 RepID=A0AAV2DKR5_9ROSI